MHFSGCRVHSPEIEFSPNPFRSTSFKDDLGKKILGASIRQIVNRAIRLGEDIHLFFLLISRKCLLPYVGMRDILIRRTPHTPVLTRLEFWFLTICCIISLFLNILVKFFQTFCDLSKIFSVGFEFYVHVSNPTWCLSAYSRPSSSLQKWQKQVTCMWSYFLTLLALCWLLWSNC